MKLIQLYLIGVFVIIGLLIASTWWQYQQFQTNVKNLSQALPQNIVSGIPNLNQDIGSILNQAMPQANNPAATGAPTGATSTKEFVAPDGSFKFNYPSNWQETTNQINGDGDNILFYAHKTTTLSEPLPNYLIVKKENSKNVSEVIDQYKQAIWVKNPSSKISEYKITNSSQQAISVLEFDYSTTDPLSGLNLSSTIKTALVSDGDNVFLILLTSPQGKQIGASEADQIFKSVTIFTKNEAAPK